MLWRTHLAFGLGVASFFTLDPIVLTLAGFLSVMPDFDHPFGHRGWFSHSVFAALVFSFVGLLASSLNLLYAWIVFLAVASHAVIDMFTKSGVPLLYPWKERNYSLGAFSAHGWIVNKAFMLLGLVMLVYNLGRAYAPAGLL